MKNRILIADDNEVARSMLGDLIQNHNGLELSGYAEDGRQAVEMAIELRPDIIILDLAMPRMDGLTAAREIGMILPSVRMVLYTLHTMEALELEAKKVGIEHVVRKPDTDELFRVIGALLEKKSDDAVREKTLSMAASVGPLTVAPPPAQPESSGIEKSETDPAEEN